MTLNFGIGLRPDQPLTPELAVRRGHYFITVPVLTTMVALWVLLAKLFPRGPSNIPTGVLIVAGPPTVAWLWWSYAVPRWRYWALSRGVDPDALQRLAQRTSLVWRKGHILEKTEFRYRPPDGGGAA